MVKGQNQASVLFLKRKKFTLLVSTDRIDRTGFHLDLEVQHWKVGTRRDIGNDKV